MNDEHYDQRAKTIESEIAEREKQLSELVKEQESIQAELDEKGYGVYAVELKSSGSLIGLLGFHWADFKADFTPCVEIGWRLVPEAWGHGYATEGARACLEHGFARLGLDRVYSFTACVNLPSQAVMQRAGMRKTAEFNHPKVAPDSVLYPHVLYVREASHA